MVRYFSIIILLALLPLTRTPAQYSIQAGHYLPLSGQDATSEDAGYTRLSAHYWTRLKRVRLAFLPGIHYQNYWQHETNPQALGIDLPIVIYPLDFINDCDCPTFSKNGEWIKKSLFFRTTPSWSWFMTSGDDSPSHFSFAIDAGVDWGLSDPITLSPFIGYEYHTRSKAAFWPAHYLHAGVQVLFRYDYRKRYR